ncbi:pyridoxal phosphate-dependent transferase [Podospora appendiculata]|uniref:Pyridoxal phosphate-dependent transferase n=1 Tax=Podospora appendiculata TaxID=314037 RepID=A0AAE0X6X3_9PEZI|nr:pyridoxal phosphate-dependent transferase [Podospora appendiculata]
MDSINSKNSKTLINLLRGWPSPHLLPAALLKKAADRALTDPSIFIPALQYAPDPGYQPLREELATWLGRAYTTPPSSYSQAEEICITGGASQSIACVLQSFTDPVYTRAVWAVTPCYFLAFPIFEDAGFAGRLRAVPEDDEGVDLAFLERGLRSVDEAAAGVDGPTYKTPGPHRKLYRHIIYIVPTCANPSGKTTSLSHRRALVHLARRHNALIISDDVYDFLQWPILPSPPTTGTPPSALPSPSPTPLLPRLSDIDMALGPSAHNPPGKAFSHAISNGSFSKLAGPGMRTGWVHATPDFAYGLSQTGSSRSGGAPSQIAAAMLHALLASGDLDTHLATAVRPALQARHAAALAAVKSELAGMGVSVRESSEDGKGQFGGYFLWLTLPGGLQAKEVAEHARREENLIVAAGEGFEVPGDEGSVRCGGNVRVCFSWEEVEDVVEGIRRLGRVLRRVQAGVGGEMGDGVGSGGFK